MIAEAKCDSDVGRKGMKVRHMTAYMMHTGHSSILRSTALDSPALWLRLGKHSRSRLVHQQRHWKAQAAAGGIGALWQAGISGWHVASLISRLSCIPQLVMMASGSVILSHSIEFQKVPVIWGG